MPSPPGPVPDGRPGPVAILADVMAAGHDDAAGLARRQRQRLTALLVAAQRTPRYRALLGRRPLQHLSLSDLPPTGKLELMAAFDASVADPALTLHTVQAFCADPGRVGQPLLGRYWAWESSGSTGHAGLFVQDETAMAVYDALEALRRSASRPWLRLVDPLYLSERFAFVGATGGHYASIVSLRRLQARHPWLRNGRNFSILQPLPQLLAALDDFGPTLLATYPTAAVMLADAARAHRLRARPYEVWTGGETLTDAMRAHIEQGLGCAVRNSYGASEFLPIAWECAHGRLHVNADWVLLEPVDEQHRPVSAGQASHTTLLTNLANHVQPLIRFDIGDRITLGAERCGCGSALPVVQVQGRQDDALVLTGRDGPAVTLLPLALTALLEDQAGVFDFELRQLGPRRLRLGLGPRNPLDAERRSRCRRLLADFARAQGALAPQISVQALAGPQSTASGKVRRIIAATPGRWPDDHS